MIEATDHDGVRVVTLRRPECLNAFDAAGYRELADALAGAGDDDGVHCVVMTGEGRAFSTGVDRRELARPGGPDALSTEFDRLLDTLLAFPKPLLAAVNGIAVGFGMTMLLHCDLVLVDEDARLRTPFTEMELAPEAGSSWLLPRAVGAQAAAYLLLTSDWIDGREAERIGFAWRCCHARTVLDETLAIARRLASLPLAPLVATKRLLRETNAAAIADAFVRERDAMASIDRSGAP
jgi:enoyl-CoA hydratase/carnithine racemase